MGLSQSTIEGWRTYLHIEELNEPNMFMISMCNFDFKENYKEIDDRELRKTMNEIYDFGIIDDFTLEELVTNIKEYDEVVIELEQQYITNSSDTLFIPLKKFLKQSFNKDCRITPEKLKVKRQKLSEKTPSKVDLALMYQKVELKYTHVLNSSSFLSIVNFMAPMEYSTLWIYLRITENGKENQKHKNRWHCINF